MKETEVIIAERDAALTTLNRALDTLDRLENMLRRTGGFLAPRDQESLREARALLVETGRRPSDAPPMWTDRPDVKRSTVKLTANGADLSRVRTTVAVPVNASAVGPAAEVVPIPPGMCPRCLARLRDGRCPVC